MDTDRIAEIIMDHVSAPPMMDEATRKLWVVDVGNAARAIDSALSAKAAGVEVEWQGWSAIWRGLVVGHVKSHGVGGWTWATIGAFSLPGKNGSAPTEAEARTAVEASFAAALSRLGVGVGVPAGWKLVPIEPTEEMLRAAGDLELQTANLNYGGSPTADDYWSAMLSASPTPPAGEGEDRTHIGNAQASDFRQAVERFDALDKGGRDAG